MTNLVRWILAVEKKSAAMACEDSGGSQNTGTDHEPGHGSRTLHNEAKKSSEWHRRPPSCSRRKEMGITHSYRECGGRGLSRLEHQRQGNPGDARTLLRHVAR